LWVPQIELILVELELDTLLLIEQSGLDLVWGAVDDAALGDRLELGPDLHKADR